MPLSFHHNILWVYVFNTFLVPAHHFRMKLAALKAAADFVDLAIVHLHSSLANQMVEMCGKLILLFDYTI